MVRPLVGSVTHPPGIFSGSMTGPGLKTLYICEFGDGGSGDDGNDSTFFKQVVQMLTESSKTAKQASNPKPASPSDPPSSVKSCSILPPIRIAQKLQNFKLYERRNSLKNGLIINPSSMHNFANHHNNFGFLPHGKPEILSPSILDFPSLVLNPVTPSREDLFNKASGNSSEEDKAIVEKGSV